MLDLNLDIVSSDSSCNETNNKCSNMDEASRTVQMEHSGTSTSSIINTEESMAYPGDENSSNNNSAFIFDILKKENSPSQHYNNGELPVQQFFPETTALELNLMPGLAMTSLQARPHQWLKLSQVEADGESELRIVQQKQQQVRKSRRGPRSRSSQYRGVTFYRRTGRWESHIWDCGKQVYLGGFDTAHAAARAYDRAAIKFRGVDADINFNLSDYEDDMKQMKNLNKEEFVQVLRRQSNGFARGSSKYRGGTLHKCGRWEAKMEQVLGKKNFPSLKLRFQEGISNEKKFPGYLPYLGLFDREVDAARAYDQAVLRCSGNAAVTNFEPSFYDRELGRALDPGASHNLDLSLGITAPSNGNNNEANCQFQWGAGEMHSKETPVVENAASTSIGVQTLHGLPIKSNNLAICSALYPGLSSSNQERGAEKRGEAISSVRFLRFPWQVNGSSNTTMSQPSIAASSGFGSSASSSTTFPFNPFVNVRPTTTSTPNISHCFPHRS